MKFPNRLLCLFLALLVSCSNEKEQKITVLEFIPVKNLSTKTVEVDFSDALEGIEIPSIRQTDSGFFQFSFQVKSTEAKLYYKLYYQNESYKFSETLENTNLPNSLSEENFYGSWEDTEVGFKPISIENDSITLVTDHIRILGNPRNEKRYYSDTVNNRWKRNPRMGEYSFLLVICTESALEKIPPYIKHIHLKNGELFLNPYYYFLFGEGSKQSNSVSVVKKEAIKAMASVNFSKGVYINSSRFSEEYKTNYFNPLCGQNENLYKKSDVEQFINYVDESTRFLNIPVIKDVFSDGYSLREYNWNKTFFSDSLLIATSASTAEYPCQNVFYDNGRKKLIIRNPASKHGDWKKESVGIITRHGMVYGKYTVKAKLTPLLNDEGMWNGLTNAIWLIGQGGKGWNNRRICEGAGYMKSYWGGENEKRVPFSEYSEIDFEILKTVKYCPDHLFPPVYAQPSKNPHNIAAWDKALPSELNEHKHDVVVACTNWDMACQQPKNYNAGCHDVVYKGQTFEAHRWNHDYRALTQKVYASNKVLFDSPYYYYEIEWKPEEIIWRIGPEKDKMKVVGYMDKDVTSIPNNQMLLIITQEFHNTKWWPGTPFLQEFIPFPGKDYTGEILEINIE